MLSRAMITIVDYDNHDDDNNDNLV